MEEHLYNSYVVAAMLILYGVAFILIENWRAKKRSEAADLATTSGGAHFATPAAPQADADFGRITDVDDLSWKTALGIGCFQVLSLVPGTSRSGSTIIGGLLLGTSRSVATRFTFFLAIPVMGVGLVVAFVVSLAAINWLTGFVRKHDFKPFGWYRICLGIVVLAYFGVKAFVL